jgi:hypothetical protein
MGIDLNSSSASCNTRTHQALNDFFGPVENGFPRPTQYLRTRGRSQAVATAGNWPLCRASMRRTAV